MKLIKQSGSQEIEIEGKVLKLTHLDKLFWPEEKFTKGDLINYYLEVAPYILKYLQDRPESLHRFPNGINGNSFYQKNIDGLAPDWADTVAIRSEEKKEINYFLCNNLPSLIYLINLGCIELNPWNSRNPKLDYPDYLVIDLDPLEIDFDFVLKTALAAKKILSGLGIKSYPKSSGATGLHIYIPLGAKYSYEQAKNFARILVNLIHEETADFTSVERLPAKRVGKVYLDYLQNVKGQTLASAYSVRPKPKATVSTPLTWNEVQEGFLPENFTINNIISRLKKVGDLFEPVLLERTDIKELLQKM